MEDTIAEASTPSVDSPGLSETLSNFGISEDVLGDQGLEAPAPAEASEEVQSASEEETPAEVEGDLTPEQILQKLSEEETKEVEDQPKKSKPEIGDDANIIANPDDIKFEIQHNGELKSFSKDEGIELMQKGFDYTQKTQAIAAERKELEETFTAKEQELSKSFEEHNEVIEQYNKLDYAIQLMRTQNPDLFEDLNTFYEEVQVKHDNPMVRGKLDQLERTIQDVQSRDSERENEMIRQSFARELEDVQARVNPSFEKLGLSPNWEKVKEAWIDGNKSVEEALYQTHGEVLSKAWASKAKVSVVKSKAKAASKVPTAGQIGRGQPQAGTSKADLQSLSWNALQDKILSGELV